MARFTAKERRERAAALHTAVERSRQQWLGKRIRFTDLLDEKTKVGVFTEVTDEGHVVVEYQMFPWWPDEPPATIYTLVGHEQKWLEMVDGVVIDEGGSVVCQHLAQDTYCVVAWEHVARAFRAESGKEDRCKR